MKEVIAYGGGPGALAWHPHGRIICVGASDASLTLYNAADLTPDASMDDLADPVTALAFHSDGDQLAVAISHDVNLFTISGQPKKAPVLDSTITRTTSEVLALSFSPNGALVAVAGGDTEIKVLPVASPSNVALALGHECPVKSVAFSGDSTLMASAGIDGRLIIWSVGEQGAVSRQYDSNVMSKTTTQSSLCHRLDWDGKRLAVPSRLDVQVLERVNNSWCVSFRLLGGHTDQVSIVSWSVNGRYLASVGLDRVIVIWDSHAKTKVASETVPQNCIALQWSPKENVIALLTDVGTLMIWDEPVPREMPHPCVAVDDIDTVARDTNNDDKEDEGDDDEERSANGEDAALEEPRKRRRLLRPDEVEEEDDDVDDYDLQSYGSDQYPPQVTKVALQKPFQPGATSDENDPWLMAWTMFGSIESSHVDDVLRRIQINFADVDSRPRIRLTDRLCFTKACLGPHSALFSSDSKRDIPGNVFYRTFDSWAANSDWSVTIPNRENVVALALVGRNAVVATDCQYLRILSYSGVHRAVFCLDHPVVTMAGSSSSELAVIVAEPSGTLRYVLYGIDKYIARKASGSCALPSGATLKWVSYSDEGMLLTMDSELMVRGLIVQNGNYEWVPLLDGTIHLPGPNSTLWPVGSSQSDLFVAILKNGQKEPLAAARPLLSGLPCSVPVLLGDASATPLEQQNLMLGITIANLQPRCNAAATNSERTTAHAACARLRLKQDVARIEMIKIASQNDNVSRALDLASTLQLEKSLAIATKVVAALNQPVLVDRLNMLASANFPKPTPARPNQAAISSPPRIRRTPSTPSPLMRPKTTPPIAVDDSDYMSVTSKVVPSPARSTGFSSQLDQKRSAGPEASLLTNSFASMLNRKNAAKQ